jgi:membrane-bound lytic murein transglycosylase D
VRRKLLFGAVAGLLGLVLAGCAPRYVSKDAQPAKAPAADERVPVLLDEADAAYNRGVDFFVMEDFDSASFYLGRAIGVLGENVDWTSHETSLAERRMLLYKCRYFLERIPAEARRVAPDAGVARVEPLKPPLPPIAVVENDKVRKWIRYFTGDGRETFEKWVRRSGRYRDLTDRILTEEGMPLDLSNLALIESGFNPNAYSRAHAVGMWQFIRSTGRIYGLRIDWWVDERRDPVRSCRAASRYLRDLHNALDSWPLALAAYNCGQRSVERAMSRARTRDYWKLRLPRETRDYVPKFMAACILMENPEQYGLRLDFSDPDRFEEVDLEPKTDLRAVAEACRVDCSLIAGLNPHLIRGCAPDGDSDYPVRIPPGTSEMCLTALAKMPRERLIAQVYASPDTKHRVRRGESLSTIAGKYGVSMSRIAAANGIRNYHKIKAGQVLTIPGEGYVSIPDNPGIHVVRRGETLSSIGHRYGVRIKDLKAWNDLKSAHVIYTGQKLIVSLDMASQQASGTHVVVRGDTVGRIARTYGVRTEAVLEANGLRSADRIYPGQKLRIPGAHQTYPAGDFFIHSVRKGETVWSIARRYGTSTSSLLKANRLAENDRIYPGQEIKIVGCSKASSGGGVVLHEVRRGETITSIARRYGTSVSNVLKANGLRSRDTIYPGQKIKVPI